MQINSYLPLIISSISAIIGVVIGVALTYFIDIYKIKNEENKKLLRNIYFRIYTEVELCYFINNTIQNKYTQIISLSEVIIKLKKLLENNIDIIDNKLFRIYFNTKLDQDFDKISKNKSDSQHLLYIVVLLMNMLNISKKTKMVDKDFINNIKTLLFKYEIWYRINERIDDTKKVQELLILISTYRHSFNSIRNSKLFNNLINNYKINKDELYETLKKYIRKEIYFPIFNKYFWGRK